MNVLVRHDGQEMLKRKSFQYFGLIIPKNGEIEKDVNHRLREWWTK